MNKKAIVVATPRLVHCVILAIFAVLLSASGSSASTPVQGDITTTTWTKTNSPYLVTDTIRVPAGETLTIEPGVDVLFDADVPFLVEGSIHAVGTEADSIRFRPEVLEWFSGATWQGMRISGGDTSTLHYVHIRGAHVVNDAGLTIAGSATRVGLHRSVISENVLYQDSSGDTLDIGAGISVHTLANVTINNCMIQNNHGSGRGGGLMVRSSAYARVTHSHITENSVSGRAWYMFGKGFLLDGGAGVFVGDSATVELLYSTISQNRAIGSGGGVHVRSGGHLLVEGCVIRANLAEYHGIGAGIYISGAQATLRRCLVAENGPAAPGTVLFEAYGGGGVYVGEGGELSVQHCTIVDNWGGGDWGWAGVAVNEASATLTNTIIWGKTRGNLWGDANVTYSNVKGHTVRDGVGNLNDNPKFVRTDAGDYRLSFDSPAIDAGDPLSPLDEDGSRADMGAFVFDPTAVGVSQRLQALPTSSTLSVAPNPFNPSTTISYSVPTTGEVTLSIYNISGQTVLSVVNGHVTAGVHKVIWDGTDEKGQQVASGVCVMRLVAGGTVQTRRMLLIR